MKKLRVRKRKYFGKSFFNIKVYHTIRGIEPMTPVDLTPKERAIDREEKKRRFNFLFSLYFKVKYREHDNRAPTVKSVWVLDI